MLKVVNSKFELPGLSHSPHLLSPSPSSEQDKRACGLELRLEPVLCVGVGVGNVDTKAAIFTQDDQSGTTL